MSIWDLQDKTLICNQNKKRRFLISMTLSIGLKLNIFNDENYRGILFSILCFDIEYLVYKEA